MSDDFFGVEGGVDAGSVIERTVADGRPGPMFAGLDRYFDEPEGGDGRVCGLMGWAAEAGQAARTGLERFASWCAAAPDGERRCMCALISTFQGRTPKGAIEEVARIAGVDRKTVQRAISRFERYFPGIIPKARRREEVRCGRARA